MAQFNPDDCKYCNNTDGVCCHEAIRTDNKAARHIIDDEADAHVFMMNGLLVAKDVVMPKAGV